MVLLSDCLNNLDKESFKKNSSLSELTKAEITAEVINDLNEVTKPFVYAVNNVKNMPVSNFSGVIMTVGFIGWRTQLAFFNNGDNFFYRRESNSIWYPWKVSTLRVV